MLKVNLSPLTRKTGNCRLAVMALLCAPLLTATAMMAPQSAKAEVEAEMAGVSAAVTGDITLAKVTGEVGVVVESGMKVYLGDRITTSAGAGMQVLLLDETVFTIGPNSDIAIDEFVYDPATGDGRIVADMAKGVMRFVTGKIPLNNPSSMDVNLPVGSIGIRGTIGLIYSMSAEEANQIVPGSFDTSDPDSANQQVFMAVNQGPGLSRNDTTSRPGAFAAFSTNGNSQNITGENFGVFVSNNTVTSPTRFPTDAATFDFSANVVRVTPRNGGNTSGSGNNGSSSSASSNGQQPVMTQQQAGQAANQTGSTSSQAIDVAMAQVGTTNSASNVAETTSILNNNIGSTSSSGFTYDGLRQIASGGASTGTVEVSSGPLSYNFITSVNFLTRELSVTFQNIEDGGDYLTSVSQGEMKTGTVKYIDSSGAVSFSGSDFTPDQNCINGECAATATFTDAYNVDFKLTTTAVSAGASGSEQLE